MNTTQKIKLLLDEKGITQKALCEKINVTQNGIKKMFDSNKFKSDTLAKIAKVLSVDIEYLVSNGISKTNDPQAPYILTPKTNSTDIENKIDYYKGQVDLLKELLKEKEMQEQRIQRNEITIPLDIRDLISESDMAKTQRFLGNDFYRSSICVSDKFGKIEYVNDEFTNQTGYTIADIRGKSAGEVLQRNDVDKSIKKKMHDALINRTYFEGEVLNYSKSGDQIKCRLIIAPIKIKGIEKLISLAVFSKVNVLKYN